MYLNKWNNKFKKKIPFVCFDPISKFILPFSVSYFWIIFLFLIFDIKITLMIPIILCLKYLNFYYIINIILLFIIKILVTLIID